MLGAQAVPQPEPRTSLGRVLRHSTLYALGNIAGRAVAFLATPVYSRFLSPAEYGLIELVELSTQTVAITFGLQAVGTVPARLFHDQASEAARNSVLLALMAAAYAATAALRGHGFLLQVCLDGVWVALFAGIAGLTLFSSWRVTPCQSHTF